MSDTKVWIVMKGSRPRALCTTEERAREVGGSLVTNFLGANYAQPVMEDVVHLRVLFLDDAPVEDSDLKALGL